MSWTLKHRRDDGSFVIELNGLPYHVTHDDPLHPEVSAAAEGVTLPDEPGPRIPTIDELAAEKRQATHAEALLRRDLLAPHYPQHEIDTWDEQRREAVAYQDWLDTTPPPPAPPETPLLSAIALRRGWTLADLVNRVVQKAAAFATGGGTIPGAQHALEDRIETVLADLDAGTIAEAEARALLSAIDPLDPTAWPD